MKRKLYAIGGLVALALAVVVTAQLGAQGTTPQAQPRPAVTAPQTKVALLNLTYVLKSYKKAQTYNEELKTAVQPFMDKDAGYKKQGEDLAKKGQDQKTSAEERERIERQLKDLQRAIEDNKTEAQKVVGKKQEDQIKTLFMDIHSVVTKLAQRRGYEMVLHFNDFTTTQEYWSTQNINRKLQAGALMPMYYVGSLDISNEVLTTLNGQAPAAPAPGAR